MTEMQDYQDRVTALIERARTSVEDRIALAQAVQFRIAAIVKEVDDAERAFKVLGGEATIDYIINRLNSVEELISHGLGSLVALAAACEAEWKGQLGADL